jgi:hypothetical protein
VRIARCKRARAEPRSAHAAFEPPSGTRDPVEILERQAAERVPELVPLRYGRMLPTPSAFYRGSALIMAGDLAGTPTTGTSVQASGDAHLNNFGLFASPERRLVFDVNDFDETLPGPWARGDPGHRRVAKTTSTRVRGAISRRPPRGGTGVRCANSRPWATSLSGTPTSTRPPCGTPLAAQLAEAERNLLVESLAKAQRRDHLQALEKLTHLIAG